MQDTPSHPWDQWSEFSLQFCQSWIVSTWEFISVLFNFNMSNLQINIIQVMPLLCSNPPMSFHHTQVKIQTLYHKVPYDLATVTFSPSSSTIFQVPHLQRTSCHSPNMSNLFLLQGFSLAVPCAQKVLPTGLHKTWSCTSFSDI